MTCPRAEPAMLNLHSLVLKSSSNLLITILDPQSGHGPLSRLSNHHKPHSPHSCSMQAIKTPHHIVRGPNRRHHTRLAIRYTHPADHHRPIVTLVMLYVGQHYVHVDLSGQIFQLCVKFGGACESVHHGIFPFSLLKLGRPQLSGSLSPVLLFHYTVFIGTVKPFL
jgi:hypothetical protein